MERVWSDVRRRACFRAELRASSSGRNGPRFAAEGRGVWAELWRVDRRRGRAARWLRAVAVVGVVRSCRRLPASACMPGSHAPVDPPPAPSALPLAVRSRIISLWQGGGDRARGTTTPFCLARRHHGLPMPTTTPQRHSTVRVDQQRLVPARAWVVDSWGLAPTPTPWPRPFASEAIGHPCSTHILTSDHSYHCYKPMCMQSIIVIQDKLGVHCAWARGPRAVCVLERSHDH